ncbi:MAG: efflux RND transporter periplasmic adaptor subunit [Vicinamibacterales bacterium]
MNRKKLLIGLLVVVVLGVIAWANVGLNRSSGLSVTTEKIEKRNLEAIVSASGTVQPQKSVNISAETMGKVVNLTVAEGDLVKRGQLLLEIDPRNLETAVQNRSASLETARSVLAQQQAQYENSQVNLQQAKDDLKRQEGLYEAGLLARDAYERAMNNVSMRETDLKVQQRQIEAQEQRVKQSEADLNSAQYDLNKVRVVSPFDGLVTRRNIEEGETAVVGTMNNAGTVLLTIADLSVIETEIEVDETDIPFITIGQPAKVTIDALPDKEFPGHVTEVGNSPIQTTTAGQRATNFKVVVTIDGAVPGVRPGFTCTAVITTATRADAVAVPIQAMTVRERVVDASGEMVKTEMPAGPAGAARRPTTPATLEPGQERKEIEGVFLIKDGRAVFQPVKIGIAGEKHFEVLSGLQAGDEVITGPFASVRNLREGDEVRVNNSTVGPQSTQAGG